MKLPAKGLHTTDARSNHWSKRLRMLNNRRGSAYLFVVVAVMIITMLAGVALAVTVATRRVSAQYIDFAGLYDLAVAGNEQALFSMQEALQTALENKQDENNEYIDMAAVLITAAAGASRSWNAEALNEIFRAVTSVSLLSASTGGNDEANMVFQVYTRVYRVSALPVPTVVRANIVLDGDTLTMVHSRRVTE